MDNIFSAFLRTRETTLCHNSVPDLKSIRLEKSIIKNPHLFFFSSSVSQEPYFLNGCYEDTLMNYENLEF